MTARLMMMTEEQCCSSSSSHPVGTTFIHRRRRLLQLSCGGLASCLGSSRHTAKISPTAIKRILSVADFTNLLPLALFTFLKIPAIKYD